MEYSLQGLGENLKRNAGEFARDFRTITGAVMVPAQQIAQDVYRAPIDKKAQAVKEAFAKTVNNRVLQRVAGGATTGALLGAPIGPIGALPGAVVGGTIGLLGSGDTPVDIAKSGAKNLANAYLSTYNTSLGDIKRGTVDINKVIEGAYTNPLYAGLDVLSIPGVARGVGSASKALSGGVSKNAPLFVQQILPSKELSKFNRRLTEELQSVKSAQADKYRAYNTLQTMPLANREEIVRNITTNTGKLTKEEKSVAKAIKEDLEANELEAISQGFLHPETARENAVAQYVMASTEGKYKDLLHDDIVAYIRGEGTRPRFQNVDLKEINKLIQQGNNLYNKGDIQFLSQALVPEKDPLGQVIANEIAKTGKGYFGTSRIIGTTPAKRQGLYLDDTIKYQLSQIGNATEVSDVLKNVLRDNTIATPVTEGMNIPKNKMVFSQSEFDKSIANMLQSGEDIDIGKALKSAQTTAGDSYMVDKVYGEAIKNALRPSSVGGIKKFTSSFKKASLAQPHWFALNRIGNYTNNMIGGVTRGDYKLANELKSIIPDKLKQQTSFNSYVGEGVEGIKSQNVPSSMKQPFTNIKNTWQKFYDGDKGYKDISKAILGTYGDLSNITANPIFRIESSFERTDRYANFIRQAKREAKATGKNFKDIIKESNKNEALYNKLNENVNKDLGDYVGRNYALPPEVYDTLGEFIPFYRFLTQTGRTTFHQLANHPLAFQSTVMAPPRAGRQLSEYILNKYNLDQERYEGGVPYAVGKDNEVRTIGFEPLPAQSVTGDLIKLARLEDVNSLANPIFSLLNNISNYQKSGGYTPTSPELTLTKLTKPSEASNYKPSPRERYGYALSQLLGTTFNPYRWATVYGPEISESLRQMLGTGKGLQSVYDTGILSSDLREEIANTLGVDVEDIDKYRNILSYNRTLPEEMVGKWIGYQSRANYPMYKQSKTQTKKEAKKASRNIQKAKANVKQRKDK